MYWVPAAELEKKARVIVPRLLCHIYSASEAAAHCVHERGNQCVRRSSSLSLPEDRENRAIEFLAQRHPFFVGSNPRGMFVRRNALPSPAGIYLGKLSAEEQYLGRIVNPQ